MQNGFCTAPGHHLAHALHQQHAGGGRRQANAHRGPLQAAERTAGRRAEARGWDSAQQGWHTRRRGSLPGAQLQRGACAAAQVAAERACARGSGRTKDDSLWRRERSYLADQVHVLLAHVSQEDGQVRAQPCQRRSVLMLFPVTVYVANQGQPHAAWAPERVHRALLPQLVRMRCVSSRSQPMCTTSVRRTSHGAPLCLLLSLLQLCWQRWTGPEACRW